jgi:predicted nucleic acid-binding protein
MGSKNKMIHLDANILILATQRNSPVQRRLKRWLEQGEEFSSSAVAWTEFLNGPLTSENKLDGEYLIQGRIVPLTKSEAKLAADLFNRTQRRQGTLPDCLVAATAVVSGCALVTHNQKDFSAFVSFGLILL